MAKITFNFLINQKHKLLMSTIFNKLLLVLLLFRSIDIFSQDYKQVEVADNINGVQPMTGIILWTDNEYNSSDAIALEYSYMLYDDVVSQQGVYNWSFVDNLLKDVASRNHQAVLRFRYAYPGYETSVPQYIKDLSDYEETIGKSEGETTYFPDWSHSELKRFTLEFYEKFAERYDNDSRLAYIQTGFGLWSEYHIYDGPFVLGETFPDKDFQESFFRHLDTIFINKTWSVSIDAADGECSPFESKPALKDLNFGLFDDSFMHEEHDDYNESCWDFFNRDRYKSHPAGGEFSYYSDYDQKHVLDANGPYGIPFETFVENFHMSYIIGSDQPEYQTMQRIKEASMCMGYKFKIQTFKTAPGSSIVTVTNVGVAPIYCDAYVAVNGVRSQTSLKFLAPGDVITTYIEAGGENALLTIESDDILASQEIGFLGNKGEVTQEEITQFTLTSKIVGEGSINPSEGKYDSASTLTLKANPADGWLFAGWSGDVSGTENPLSLKMDSNISVTATFTEIISVEYTLNTTINGSGSLVLSPEGGKYTSGTVVNVKAVPETGWAFDKWEGDIVEDDNPISITMNSNMEISVFFYEDEEESSDYSLTLEVYGEGEVQIDPEKDYYEDGEKVTLTATPKAGWAFDMWEGDIEEYDNPLTIAMESDMEVSAVFYEEDEEEESGYTLIIESSGQGDVIIDPGYEYYEEGTKVTVTAVPEEGWKFSEWSGDIYSPEKTSQFTINSDMEVIAEFVETKENKKGFQYYKFTCTETNNSWFLVKNIDLIHENNYYNLSSWWYDFGMPTTIEKTVDLGTPIEINCLQVTPGWYTNCAPRDFKLEGSNDNLDWTLLLKQNDLTSSTWSSGVARNFDFKEGEIQEFLSNTIEIDSDNQSLLYPNPTNGFVYLSSDIVPENIKIINMMGQIVMNADLMGNRVIDISKLMNGVYIVQIDDAKVRLVKE
jgi:hypothetical protein